MPEIPDRPSDDDVQIVVAADVELVAGLDTALGLPAIGGRDFQEAAFRSAKAVRRYVGDQFAHRSKQTAADALRRLARLLTQGRVQDAELFPWSLIDREFAGRIRTTLYDATLTGALSPGTANLTVTHLRGLIRVLDDMDLITDKQSKLVDPKGVLKRIPGSRIARGRSLTTGEEDRLHAVANDLGGLRGELLHATVATSIGTGLRREEVGRLTPEAFDSDLLSILGKGNKQRRVPIIPEVREATNTWLKHRATLTLEHGFMFCAHGSPNNQLTPWGFWSLVRSAAHIAFGDREKCSKGCRCLKVVTGPHDFRRTFATRMLESGADIRQLQVLMGHESPETTALYDKRSEDSIFEMMRNVKGLVRSR